MNTRVVAAFAQKDIVDAIRNRYLLVAISTPLFAAILLNILVPNLNNNVTIVAHDGGNSRLVAELRAVPQLNVVQAESAEAVPKQVENSKAIGGLVVPANFDADVAANKQPELVIYVNNKRTGLEQGMFRQMLDRQIQALANQPPPARVNWIDINKETNTQPSVEMNLNQMLLPLLLLLTFTMTGALVVPLLLVEEKEKRTLDFLLTSPASLSEITAGKALTGVVYSVLIAGFLLAINNKLVGNWPLTLLTVSLGILFVVGVGLFMGSLFENTMQVNTWAGAVLFVLLVPGFPSMRLPEVIDKAMHLIPTQYFVEALRLTLPGTVSPRIWGQLAILAGSTVIAFLAAIWGLRRQQN